MTTQYAARQNLPPKVETLLSEIVKLMPLHLNFLEQSLGKVTLPEIDRLEKYLDFCQHRSLDLPYLARCYVTIVEDTLGEEIYFRRHGKYRHDSFAAVANDVYFNDDYMARYMYGLAITGYFWPNHLRMHRFFAETLPRDKTGHYLEIGPGHGNYIARAMEESAYQSFTGVDISETSIRLTDDILRHFGAQDGRYNLLCTDFLTAALPLPEYDAIVMGEVLEHVERPDLFLQRIRDIASDDAYIFITTCANAPSIDHIYLFRTHREVEDLIRACGLEIVAPLVLPYEGKTVEACEALLLAVSVAYVLKKKR